MNDYDELIYSLIYNSQKELATEERAILNEASIVYDSYKRGKTILIDNAKPSKALEEIKQIEFYVGTIIGLKFIKGNDVFSEAKKQDYEIFEKKSETIRQYILKAQEQEQKLNRVEKLTNLPFKERRKIGQEYIKWCQKNNAVFDDATNMITWVLCIKLKEVF